MSTSRFTSAGEVTVGMIEAIPSLERKSILLLRHANKLASSDEKTEFPPEIREVCMNQGQRFRILKLLDLIALNSRRPLMYHEPTCKCIGADENVFANLIRFSGDGNEDEALILASLIVRSSVIGQVTKEAAIISYLLDYNLSEYQSFSLSDNLAMKKTYLN